MNTKPMISIMSPVYRGEKLVQLLVDRNTIVLQNMADQGLISDYEILLINDCSPDESWKVIKSVCQKDKHVKGVNLSRNYGQQCAIKAGMSCVSGDWIVVMDCDLQDRPEEIPSLYAKAQEGYDIVRAQRMNKQFGYWKKMSSKAYHVLYNWLSGTNTDDSIGNFGIYSKQVIDEFNKLPEQDPDFIILVDMLGFNNTQIPVEHAARAEGTSTYTLAKLLKLTFDSILSNTNKPLKMSAYFGFTMAIISVLLALYNVSAKLLGIIELEGYTTTIFSIWFVGSLILAQLGILGLYLGKMYDQVKNRPVYVIRDKVNL